LAGLILASLSLWQARPERNKPADGALTAAKSIIGAWSCERSALFSQLPRSCGPLFAPTESQAFGIRVGPFYFGFPSFWHRRWHHSGQRDRLRDEASMKTGALGQTGGLMSPLIYPVLALPTVYGEIFSPPSSAPSSSPWPFSYDAIFQAAFAKTASAQNANSCPQLGGRPVIADRIKTEIKPTPDQMQPLQKLGGALGFASDYLAKACPTDIPQDPAARCN
jgi:hypothetical protein